jgi:hypothetical protein
MFGRSRLSWECIATSIPILLPKKLDLSKSMALAVTTANHVENEEPLLIATIRLYTLTAIVIKIHFPTSPELPQGRLAMYSE